MSDLKNKNILKIGTTNSVLEKEIYEVFNYLTQNVFINYY